ncbi:D-aminoacylase [candidate division KSB1 bacterium]|nr:D-aminoacylase [candidate division KSB1 bacterium]
MPSPHSRRDFLKACGAVAASYWLHPSCSFGRDFDFIIVGGLVYDGSGKDGVFNDVGIKAGRIAALGDLKDRSAQQKIEAHGLAVAPGFIDFHSHSDEELLLGGEAQSKIRQGVTTEVLGQDGGSLAPLNEKMALQLVENFKERFGLEVAWRDFAGYFRNLEARGMISNALSMVGQGTLRELVIGEDNRPATAEDLAQMKQLAQEAFAQGAYGISSGLEYTPGSFATTEEIIELCRSMNGRGIYSTHMRNEDETLLEAIDEAIRIAREAGVALNIAHIKASGQRNWHKQGEMLAKLEAARAGGLQVTCDRYPYIAYNTGLSSLFPLWSRDGGDEKFVARLQDAALQDTLRAEVWHEVEKIGGWRSVMISSLTKHPRRGEFEGKTFEEIAATGADPFAKLFELIIAEEGGGNMIGFAMSEEDTTALLAHPYCMPASDGSALGLEGRLRRGNPHPRSFGTFPRVLGKYVRDDQIMSMAEAIRKMSALPADTLGLKDRGYLRAGYWADVVVFDPNTVADRATWAAPFQYPAGIPYVFVNGELVLAHDKLTGKLAGKVLRAPFSA